MVGKPAAPPEHPINALGNATNCVSFAAAAKKKRRFVYARPSATRAPLFPAAAPAVIELRSHEMRLRFGIASGSEADAPQGAATDVLD